MTSKASRNAILAACGIASAAGVYAAAVFLAPPPPAPAPAVAEAIALPEAQAGTTAAHAPQPAPQPAPPALPSFANVDPAAFGVLPVTMSAAPLTPLRGSLLDTTKPLAISSTTSLETIGATFADPGSGMPQLGGASALDGPADAGLSERVTQSAVVEPQAPPPKGKIIVIDASEGTKLDPLRQRNWDLNAVQVIPPSVPTTQR